MRVVFLPLFFRMKKNCRFFAAFYQKNYKTAMSLFEKGHPADNFITSNHLETVDVEQIGQKRIIEQKRYQKD